jgi:hypothetical protein
LRRTEGGEDLLVPCSRGFWTSSNLFVAVQEEGDVSTTLWDPVRKEPAWVKPGVRALSSSPEADRVLVESGEDCGASQWSVLSLRTGRVQASFERKAGRYCCDAGYVWAPRPGQASWLVVDDGVRLVLIAPGGRVQLRAVPPCGGRMALGKRYLKAGNMILDLTSLGSTIFNQSPEHLEWSPSEEFLAGSSTFVDTMIWNARKGSDVRSATDSTNGGFRWVNARRCSTSLLLANGGACSARAILVESVSPSSAMTESLPYWLLQTTGPTRVKPTGAGWKSG